VIQMADKTLEVRYQCTCRRLIVHQHVSIHTDSRSYLACCGLLGSYSP
jgi:hypothetical protein